jgi:shikimate dehydrogenase
MPETVAEAAELDGSLREAVEAADLVVNATPLGMSEGDELPIPGEWLHEGQIVADMVYRPAVTPLLQAAAARGARPVGGLGMLVAQGAIAIEIWNQGVQNPAPRDVMRAAAERALSPGLRDRGGE